MPREVDARWNLVQMSWVRRGPVAGVRDALSGSQDGRCAYCHTPCTDIGTSRVAVDHVLPWVLMTRGWQDGDLRQVSNLVLACYEGVQAVTAGPVPREVPSRPRHRLAPEELRGRPNLTRAQARSGRCTGRFLPWVVRWPG